MLKFNKIWESIYAIYGKAFLWLYVKQTYFGIKWLMIRTAG
jgi:hypothetical protein